MLLGKHFLPRTLLVTVCTVWEAGFAVVAVPNSLKMSLLLAWQSLRVLSLPFGGVWYEKVPLGFLP